MTEQNRSSFAVVTFYATGALVAAIGLAIFVVAASVAYVIAQSIR